MGLEMGMGMGMGIDIGVRVRVGLGVLGFFSADLSFFCHGLGLGCAWTWLVLDGVLVPGQFWDIWALAQHISGVLGELVDLFFTLL
jgi:hypothetical protein